jgi:hypothetical protein
MIVEVKMAACLMTTCDSRGQHELPTCEESTRVVAHVLEGDSDLSEEVVSGFLEIQFLVSYDPPKFPQVSGIDAKRTLTIMALISCPETQAPPPGATPASMMVTFK